MIAPLALYAVLVTWCPAQTTVRPSTDPDPTLRQAREEDFLRALADLDLSKALDDLATVDPPTAESDPATAQLRAIAYTRMRVRQAGATVASRRNALDDLREVRTALTTALASDPRVPLWLGDVAEDDLVLGFLGAEEGIQAIAGSPVEDANRRAAASLSHALAALAEADRADAMLHSPEGTELEGRLAHDREGRRPMLTAAIEALALAIDRSKRSPAETLERRESANVLLESIQRLRSVSPVRLRIEADLAEAAAAAVAPDPDAARFAAARLALAGDAVACTLARVFAVDSLVEARRGEEALAQLRSLVGAQGMPTALSLLCADAFVRTRVALGKSAASEAMLGPWIAALRAAAPPERASMRTAVLDRIAGALREERIDGPLPAIAEIALARARALESADANAELALLAQLGSKPDDAEAQACALLSLADVHIKHARWGEAADALVTFARRLSQEPSAADTMSMAIEIELALDREAPDERIAQLERTLSLAMSHYPELSTRARTEAQLAAIGVRRQVRELAAAWHEPAAERSAEFEALSSRLQLGARAAIDAGLDPGPRVAAAVHAAAVASDILSQGSGSLAIVPPIRADWMSWNLVDGSLVAPLRLERAARCITDSAALESELASIPNDDRGALEMFLTRRIAGATSQNELGNAGRARQIARAAVDLASIWIRSHRANHPQSISPRLSRLRTDVALLAEEWDLALESARTGSKVADAEAADLRRLIDALRGSLSHPGESATSIEMQAELMTSARRLADLSPKGSDEWWLGQVAQLEVARATGRGGEPLHARIARLRAIDPQLGGAVRRAAIEAVELAASGPAPG
ncbi:MAG: hypothetical protein EXS03_05695 [Phycisphaerales bacterium]|nr:hypothetical protein [Phycisphaerales bacterium]